MSTDAAAEAAALLGSDLINEIFVGATEHRVKKLLDDGAPIWYQHGETGWSALHAAAFQRSSQITKLLLGRGAVWNAGMPLFRSGFVRF